MPSEYMTLIGTEQVQSAAVTMRSAAEQMSRAASAMEDSFFKHQRFMDDWLERFASVLAEHGKEPSDVE